MAKAKPKAAAAVRRSQSAKGDRLLYVLLPGAKPRLASEVRSSELGRATAYCYTGDPEWSSIDEGVDLSA